MQEIIGQMLPYVSALLQWARAQEKFRELYFLGIVVAASALFYGITDQQAFREPWQEILAGLWEKILMIMASTQIVSSLSRVANDAGVSASVLPVTNSK